MWSTLEALAWLAVIVYLLHYVLSALKDASPRTLKGVELQDALDRRADERRVWAGDVWNGKGASKKSLKGSRKQSR